MWDPAEHLKATLEHPYEADACFVCGTQLDNDTRTDEHVIPSWLQERYALRDKTLTLLNRTTIPYRQLTVPCCFRCNNERLSPLENRVATAFASGYRAVCDLPKFDLFRWLSKIYLGLQFKELSLPADRSAPDDGTILSAEFLQQYSILHFWLQLSSRNDNSAFAPGSLWVFPAQRPNDVEEQFDLRDDAGNGVIAIRAGEVAVVADFLDNGVHAEISEETFAPLAEIPLHPLQFIELVAHLVYNAKRLCMETRVRFYRNGRALAYTIECKSTVEGDESMTPWVIDDFAEVFSFYSGIPVDEILFDKNLVLSFLRDPEGQFVHWPVGEMQYPV